eukprot:Colp12_sorted_trinity150504_noHs@30526
MLSTKVASATLRLEGSAVPTLIEEYADSVSVTVVENSFTVWTGAVAKEKYEIEQMAMKGELIREGDKVLFTTAKGSILLKALSPRKADQAVRSILLRLIPTSTTYVERQEEEIRPKSSSEKVDTVKDLYMASASAKSFLSSTGSDKYIKSSSYHSQRSKGKSRRKSELDAAGSGATLLFDSGFYDYERDRTSSLQRSAKETTAIFSTSYHIPELKIGKSAEDVASSTTKEGFSLQDLRANVMKRASLTSINVLGMKTSSSKSLERPDVDERFAGLLSEPRPLLTGFSSPMDDKEGLKIAVALDVDPEGKAILTEHNLKTLVAKS